MKYTGTLITIITPTYNAEKFIDNCIKSVNCQSFASYEHLIIDGASADNTVDIVKKYQKLYSNLKLITAKDNGVYDAMNKGIRQAQSEWLYFLGADDTLYNENVLMNISKEILKEKTQIIYGDVYFEKSKRLYDNEFNVEKILTRNICHQAIFYENTVFKEMGEYNLRYSLESDYDFNLRCWLSGKITHRYVALTIANYADGGISSIGNDSKLIEDYPENVINIIDNGNWSISVKIYFLSKAFRKIFQRYSFAASINKVIKKNFFFRGFFALSLMVICLPFSLLNKRDSIIV